MPPLMDAGSCLPALSRREASEAPLGELSARIQDGDLDAFETMMRLTEGRVLGVAFRMLGDRELARDAAQEVYLRVHRSIGSFRLGEDLRGWIYRITVNVCHDQARRRGPLMGGEALLEHLPMGGGEAGLLRQERRALVQKGLAALSPSERAALVLRDLEGLDTLEVSRILGVRPSSCWGSWPGPGPRGIRGRWPAPCPDLPPVPFPRGHPRRFRDLRFHPAGAGWLRPVSGSPRALFPGSLPRKLPPADPPSPASSSRPRTPPSGSSGWRPPLPPHRKPIPRSCHEHLAPPFLPDDRPPPRGRGGPLAPARHGCRQGGGPGR